MLNKFKLFVSVIVVILLAACSTNPLPQSYADRMENSKVNHEPGYKEFLYESK